MRRQLILACAAAGAAAASSLHESPSRHGYQPATPPWRSNHNDFQNRNTEHGGPGGDMGRDGAVPGPYQQEQVMVGSGYEQQGQPPDGIPGDHGIGGTRPGAFWVLQSYTGVAFIFFYLMTRAVQHYDYSRHIENPVRMSFVKFLASGLLVGNCASCGAALMKQRSLKSLMKLMLSFNIVWEFADFSTSLSALMTGRQVYFPQPEMLGNMFWNFMAMLFCISFRKANWV